MDLSTAPALKRLMHYLGVGRLVQIATVGPRGEPWVSTVYYVADEQGTLYWLSYPERRHSQNVQYGAQAAIAIAIEAEPPVIGVQAKGTVTTVDTEEQITAAMGLYVAKYGTGSRFLEVWKAGKNRHQLYRFVPSGYELFDERYGLQDKTEFVPLNLL